MSKMETITFMGCEWEAYREDIPKKIKKIGCTEIRTTQSVINIFGTETKKYKMGTKEEKINYNLYWGINMEPPEVYLENLDSGEKFRVSSKDLTELKGMEKILKGLENAN